MTNLKVRDLNSIYVLYRLGSAASLIGWIVFWPRNEEKTAALYAVGVLFALYSIGFCIAMIWKLNQFKRYYIWLAIPDTAVLGAMALLSPALHSYVTYGLLAVASLNALYYGLRLGITVAVGITLMDIARTVGMGAANLADLFTRLGLIWLFTITTGLLARKVEGDRERIEYLSWQLDSKAAVLFNASRIISSANNLKELVLLSREAFDGIFAMDEYAFYMIDEKAGRIALRLTRGLPRETERAVLKKTRDGIGTLAVLAKRGQDPKSLCDDFPSLRVSSPNLQPLIIHQGNESIAVLWGRRKIINEWSTEDVEMLGHIVGQTAISMENAMLYRQVRNLSIKDGLTGLFNHRYMREKLEQELGRAVRHEHPVALVLFDVDNFKAYNDTYGHLKGDLALGKIASVLRSCSRSSDIVARYGGEEFAIIAPETDIRGAMAVAERARLDVEQAFIAEPLGSSITLSAGVAACPVNARTSDELISQADQALYKAKSQGKNLCVDAGLLGRVV
ncbi:MAG: GGDEF domain-containing protein [Candidatus Aquicultorales bacterium]